MNKRITSILLVVVMCMTMIASAIPASAAASAYGPIALTITANKTTAAAGDTITYTVSIGAVEHLRSAGFKLSIPDGLTFVSGQVADGLATVLDAEKATFNETTKKLTVYGNGDYTNAGDTVLMTFTCTVDEDSADKTLAISLVATDTVFGDNVSGKYVVTVNNDASAVTVTSEPEPEDIAVTGVTLNKATLTLTEGETATLTATVSPEDATNPEVTWTSDNTDAATVDANGNVTAVGAGTATITAKAGDETAECTVTVNPAPVPVSNVDLNEDDVNLVVGQNRTLTATVTPDNADDKTVTWTSDNTDVATVDANGNVTAVGAGEATITAEAGGKTATCKVTVSAIEIPVEGVTLDKGSFTLTVGRTKKLTATVIPSNATFKEIKWSSAPKSVATVDANGYVTALSEGEAIITVTVDGKTATCTVTVTAAEKDPYYTDAREYYALQNIPTVYRLTFKTNGGSALKDIYAPRGTAIPLNAFVPEKEGYEFDGWYEDEALTELLTSWKVVSNKTVYAAWTEADPEIEIVELPFIDVFESDSYYADVEYVYSAGLMNGVSELLFAPDKTLSRAMIVTILYRLEGEPAFMNDNIFTDVEADSWYEKAVVWANGKGIVLGYGDGTFGPNNNVTREQMAAILYRYAEYKGYDVSADEEAVWAYEDAENIDAWALSAMQWACGNMLLDDTDGALRPVEDATRAEVAVLLHRFCVAIEG